MAADGNQIVENSRSDCKRLVCLALCLMCNCAKGQEVEEAAVSKNAMEEELKRAALEAVKEK